MAVSAKMVLAASRSFTERSPTFDPPRQKSPTTSPMTAQRQMFARFLLVCRGVAQTQRRKRTVPSSDSLTVSEGLRRAGGASLVQWASDVGLELIEGPQIRPERLQVGEGGFPMASLSIEEVEQALSAAAVCELDGVAGLGRLG